jgi:hypothetical protein
MACDIMGLLRADECGRIAMPHPRYTAHEIGEAGRRLYADRVRSLVETPENIGKQVTIDIETGEYDIDADGMSASRRLQAKHPGAALYGIRIGYNAVYSLGGSITRTMPE